MAEPIVLDTPPQPPALAVPPTQPPTPPIASPFLLQIIYKETGEVVQWQPGRPIEIAFAEDICARLELQDIGFWRFRTRAQIAAAVKRCVADALYALKARV
jgi:hypothetical protein